MPSVTLTELQQYVLDRLDANSTFFTTTEITNALNEAYRLMNVFCQLNQTTATVSGNSVINQSVYQTPAPILIPLVVNFAGRQLRKMSFQALARNFPGFASDATVKLGRVQRWAPIGINQFLIHPMDSVGGRTITVTGVIEPTPLASGGDVLSLDDDFVSMAVEYAAHRVQLKEGGQVFSDASLLLQRFYGFLKQRMRLSGMTFPRYFVLSGPTE